MIEKDTLHAACYNQDVDLVKQRLVDIKLKALNTKRTDYSNPIQGTPLHIACKNGNLEIVTLLIEAGADKELKDVARQSPLSIAAANNYYEIAHYLLEMGADVHSKGPNNLQPIHFACSSGDRKMIELLLSKGVDVNLVDSLKSSLLDFTTCLDGGNLEAAKALVENGIDKKHVSTGFKEACWRNNVAIAEYLVACGADVQSQTTPKSELLFWICELGHTETVKFLVGLGVDFKTKAKFRGKMRSYDERPLDRAIERDHQEIIRILNHQ